ncbi:Uma2 family endonuclease [Roseiflexus sp.]|uniref:Uma2 family endonuclease n=1 Tax=Roseiflexus sp. TaxID=2562120 RepID=UPI0021DEA99B|nr:Uma2 family endonuclease [Roseiflexus sp.]GIW00301.1 MAG: restriction endonuclease [Roseiflexus sp.]
MTALVIKTDSPVVAGPLQGHWTLADWEALPDDGNRYEIIDGVLYMTTAPHSFHQWIILSLIQFVGLPVRERGLGYMFMAPIGVIMPGFDPVQPDLIFIRAERADLFRNGRIYGVPDLIVEVLSPGTRAYDERVKLAAYAAAGVPEYAIVDPEAHQVRRYLLEAPGRYAPPQVAEATAQVAFACLPDIAFRVADLFAGAPDTTV